MDTSDYCDFYEQLNSLCTELSTVLDQYIDDKEFRIKIFKQVVSQYKREYKGNITPTCECLACSNGGRCGYMSSLTGLPSKERQFVGEKQ